MRLVALSVALSLLALAPAEASILDSLAHVGTLAAIDPAARTLRLLGGDGTERTFALAPDAALLRERGGDPTLEELVAAVGRPIGLFLMEGAMEGADARGVGQARDAASGSATLVSLLLPPTATDHGWLREVDRTARRLRFEASDGVFIAVRPAANTAGVPCPEPRDEAATWRWFAARIDQPFAFRLVRVAGLPFLWSIETWQPPAEAGALAP